MTMRGRTGRRRFTFAAGLASAAICGAASADEADVVSAKASCNAESICRFTVTVRHADIGWSHYADRFEILDPNGKVLGTRVLRHPHVHEQPFTRALAGVKVPADLTSVTIRARDSVHGYGGKEYALELNRPKASESP